VLWLLLALILLWIAFGPWVLVAGAALLLVPRVRHWVLDRVRLTWRAAGVTALVLAVLAGVVLVLPDGLLPVPQSPGVLASPTYEGRPATARGVDHEPVPRHPHLAPNGANSMHNDAWATDAYEWAGPLGEQPEVDTAWYGIEECATLTFDSADRLVALCGDLDGPTLHVIDPESMRKLATKDLPSRPDSDKPPWQDLCGGAYMYLDDRDRAVLATTDRRIMAVTTADGEGRAELTTDETWDLTPYVPDGDCLVALLPDWSGRIWWITQAGLVGTIVPESGEVRVEELGEVIANSFAADADDSVYVVTDHALYRLEAAADGTPTVTWRSEYDRGSEVKPGQLSQGSGTTPTLVDGGLVAITDNAEPRMNVVFLRRSDGSEVCREPVFEAGASATENSVISLGTGVVVENNHGYGSPLKTLLGRATSPGFTRVDVVDGECVTVWENDRVAPSSVPKASWRTGLVYAYTKRPSWTGVSSWYLTAIDAHTGRHRFSVRTGTGILMNNHYAATTIAPDGSVFIATLAGLVRVRDRRS
jgi:hypothetical protein